MNGRALNRCIKWGALSALGALLSAAPARAAQLSTEAAADLEIDDAFIEGLDSPTDVAPLPDGRVVVIERAGNVFTKTPGEAELAEAHIDVDASHGEQGLLGVVADPGFATNNYLYFYASRGDDAANRHHVVRYKLGADGQLSDMKVVIDMGLNGPANHNGGALDIYDGNLYVGVGDTGANSTPPTNKFSSCLNRANGKVLRVSLAEATLGQPPADNPLVAVDMVTGCDSTRGDFGMRAPEKRIFAWGFRNPFRLWVDRTSGKVWVGDVGEETREEITIAIKGSHNGYPFHEGTKIYSRQEQSFQPDGACMGLTPAVACTAPVVDWDRGQRGTAIGGRILDGCDWPAAWKSRYIFGDHEQGQVWTIDVNATRDGMVAGSQKDFATTNDIRALRMGTDNALYMVEGNGRVNRVTAKGTTTTANSCPAVDGPAEPGGMGGSGAGGNGSAGTSNAAGSGNVAGGNSTAGKGTGGAGTTGGSASTAGSPTSSGGTSNAGSGGTSPGDTDSCACRTVGGGRASLFGLGALSAAAALAWSRRRRRS